LKEPWDTEELFLRLEKVTDAWSDGLDFGDLTLSLSGNRVLTKNGAAVLSHPELLLLRALLKNRGRIVPREVLFYALWGKPPSKPSRVVDMHISSLRRKLGTLLFSNPIATVRGMGYFIG
jgi:DNA-binding response OmpR family regulator